MEKEKRVESPGIESVSGIVDFTCITKPRIDIGSEDTYIAAYLHGGNAALNFSRTTYTYTSDYNDPLGLPSEHHLEPHSSSEGDEISILRLPAAGGRTRIGAFACNARIAGSGNISIGTVIMSRNADFLPTRVSQTVNRGDAVNLTVTATDPARTDTRWRKNGGGVFSDRSDSLYFDFINATRSNSGVFEVHLSGQRSRGNQALMRLIVTACTKNKWNAPSCDRDCPVCLNGGVCDDRNGDCICPPGFSGDLCEMPVGPNRFGQSGSFGCYSPELGGGPTCAGKLFCLPDPYGCSCAAGYQGIDCDETCADGFYGADCAQTCHCMDGVACDRTTGECRGDCAPGFTGINCQDVIQSLTLEPSRNDIRVSWSRAGDELTLCPRASYCVSYQLLNLEQCQPQTDSILEDAGIANDNSIVIRLLYTHSTYRVHVASENNTLIQTMETTTEEGVPLVGPNLIYTSSSNQNARFSWHPIPCGERGGNITGYTYELRGASGAVIETENTTAESVEVDGLSQGAPYSFRLRAFTRVGPGPWTTVAVESPKVNYADSGSYRNAVIVAATLGVVIGALLITAALASLIAFTKYGRRRKQHIDNREYRIPKAVEDAEVVYDYVRDEVEL
ncbi:uncharacterized protein LOC119736637 [Patiria miniata]|uniref:Uncharacterized protein n=1 Tax=Patiria miniata TaxID=46514 RepID=A0A914ASX7_PATMI|nr:uncharacterized protein LOC119736637 [Patiria miniata]